MATTPLQTMGTLEHQLITDLQAKLHKTIYAHVGIIVLLIASLFGAGYVAVKIHERDLAHAEQLQQQFNQQSQIAAQAQKQLADIIAADTAQRAQEAAKQQQIELAMAQRAQTPPPAPVVEALKPSADAATVVLGLQVAYGDSNPPMAPSVTSDGKIAVSVRNAQDEVQKAVDAKRLSLDLADTRSLYALEQSKTTTLNQDLNLCQSTVSKDQDALKKAEETIKAYEKVARQSRFRKILGNIGRNAERIGILIAGIELGHKL